MEAHPEIVSYTCLFMQSLTRLIFLIEITSKQFDRNNFRIHERQHPDGQERALQIPDEGD